MTQTAITVIGAGSWGTALAILIAKNGYDTCLWGREPDLIEQMSVSRSNERYLPGRIFPSKLQVCADLAYAVASSPDILIVVPSNAFESTLSLLQPFLKKETRIAWGTKGLVATKRCLLHELVQEKLGETTMAVIAGPSFASEVADGLPTAVAVAANDDDFAQTLCQYLKNPTFKAYRSNDLIGAQVGGIIKNILAIAAGMADGLGCGANARSALITRGLAEVMRFGVALGAKPETLYGLSGLGDLVLTATDNQSRNRRFGLALGRGLSVVEAEESVNQCVEGLRNCAEVYELAQKLQVDMPITTQVYEVLFNKISAQQAMDNLLRRETTVE